MDKELSVIIPAAGLARRMKSYGPKSLITISNRSLINRQLSLIKHFYPQAEIILVLGFQLEKVIKELPEYVKVVENPAFSYDNVAYSMQLGIKAAAHKNVLIVYGDLIFNESALEFPLSSSCIVTDKNHVKDKDLEVGVTVVNNNVEHFCYGLPEKWAQIVYLTRKELELYNKISNDTKTRKYYGFEMLNLILSRGGKFTSFSPADMLIMDIDNAQDIETAKGIFT